MVIQPQPDFSTGGIDTPSATLTSNAGRGSSSGGGAQTVQPFSQYPIGPSRPGFVQGTADAVQDPNAQTANPVAQPVLSVPQETPITFNPSDFKVPVLGDVNDPNSLVGKAYASLAPYYTQLLQESGGDVNRAIARLKEDYQTGVRYTQEDVARETGYTQADLAATLKSLGLQFLQEKNQKTDVLNQRGIAVTQGDAGKLAVAGAGEGGTEMSQLLEDQQLRQEAQQRAASQRIETLGIQGQRAIDTASKTETRGVEDVTRQQQQYGEQLQQERESRALGIGQAQQQEQLAQQSLDVQKKQLEAASKPQTIEVKMAA